MNRERIIKYITDFPIPAYQPIVFVPGVLEIKGKWHEETKLLAKTILQDVGGKDVLDLGCHHGFYLHEAIRHGARRVVGVDHDPHVIQTAKEINDIFNDPIELIKLDFRDYNASSKFDLVLMLNILHNIDNPKRTVENFIRDADQIIIEHPPDQLELFSDWVVETSPSPRSFGYRSLSVLQQT